MNSIIFANRLAALIDEHGLNKKDLAEKIDSTPPTITRYTKRQRKPEFDHIIKIANYFNVSADWLLGRDDRAYSGIPEHQVRFIKLYSMASEDDRRIINQILKKYEQQNEE